MPRKALPKIQMVDPVTGKPIEKRILPQYRSRYQDAQQGKGAYQPTDKERNQVSVLISCGLTHEQICTVLGISDQTLRKYFQNELDTGFAKVYGQMATTLVQNALIRKDKACLIFWLKTRAQWSETNKVNLSGENGGPIDLRSLSTEELVVALGSIEGGPRTIEGSAGGSEDQSGDYAEELEE